METIRVESPLAAPVTESAPFEDEAIESHSAAAAPETIAEPEDAVVAPADFELELTAESDAELELRPESRGATPEAAVLDVEAISKAPAKPEAEPELVVEIENQTEPSSAEVVIEPELIVAELTSAEEEAFAEPDFLTETADREPIHMTAELVLPPPPEEIHQSVATFTEPEAEKPLKQAF